MHDAPASIKKCTQSQHGRTNVETSLINSLSSRRSTDWQRPNSRCRSECPRM